MSNAQGAVLVNGAELDAALVYLPIEITHGRSTMFAQPDAPAAEFETHGPEQLAHVGDLIELRSGANEGTFAEWNDNTYTWDDPVRGWTGEVAGAPPDTTRFIGEVSEVQAVEESGAVVGYTHRAIGPQAQLGWTEVALSRPTETDVDRVAAIAAAAGVTINIVGDPSLSLSADNIDRDALSAIYEVCNSTGALFWQNRDGTLTYGTSNARSGAATGTVPAEAILDGLEWVKDRSQIVNHITISYPFPAGPPSQSGTPGAWDWSEVVGVQDPGSGNLILNDDDGTAVTVASLSRISSRGTDLAPPLRNFRAGLKMFIQENADADVWVQYRVTDDPIDHGTWFEFPVIYIGNGIGGDIKNKAEVLISFRDVQQAEQETYSDTDSITEHGRRHVDVSTLCADVDEAGLLALTILARRGQPFWNMPGVMIPIMDLDLETANAVEALEVSEGILAPVPDIPGDTPAAVQQWAVEGWVEQWADDGRWMQLAISDWARSSAAVLRDWAEVRDTMDWEAAATKSWQTLIAEVV